MASSRDLLGKAVEGINVHAKFKSAYYFSIQPLEALCDPSIGRCYQNALYALKHGCVRKILIGLDSFPEDDQVSKACLKILDVMTQAADADQISAFSAEGGLDGVIKWIVETTRTSNLEALKYALHILVSVAPTANVTRAVPILLQNLNSSENHAWDYAQQICDTVIAIAESYQGSDLQGLNLLVDYMLRVSEITEQSRQFKRLIESCFITLKAVAAKSSQAREFILDLLELKDRYEDEKFTETYLLPLLNGLCTREEGQQAIKSLLSNSYPPGIRKLLYQIAYHPDIGEIVQEQNAYSRLVSLLEVGAKAAKSRTPLSEDNFHLVRGTCLCLANMCQDPEQFKNISKTSALQMGIQLITDASGDLLPLASIACQLVAPLLKSSDSAVAFVKGGALSALLHKLEATSDSKLLLGASQIFSELSKHPVCCQQFKQLNVLPQFMAAVTEGTFNSIVSHLLHAITAYISRCPREYLDEVNILLLIKHSLDLNHVTSRIISETAQLIQALSSAEQTNAQSKGSIVLNCVDHVTNVEEPCFSDCVQALKTVSDLEPFVDAASHKASSALQHISSKPEEAHTSLMQLAALCSVNMQFVARPKTAEVIRALPTSMLNIIKDNRISEYHREALVTTATYLVQATTDPVSGWKTLFKVVESVDSGKRPEILVLVLDQISKRVERLGIQHAGDEELLPTTTYIPHLCNKETAELLIKCTRGVLVDHGDSRSGSVAGLELLRTVILSTDPYGVRSAIENVVVKDVISIVKRLKIWAEVQMAAFKVLELILRSASQDEVTAVRDLGVVEIIKSAEVNHARNKELRSQIFRVSVLVMQTNYLEEIIKTLIANCDAEMAGIAKSKDHLSTTAEYLDQLTAPLSEPEAPRLALRHKITKTLVTCANALIDPEYRDHATVLIEPLSKCISLIARYSHGSSALVEAGIPYLLTQAAKHQIDNNASQISFPSALLSSAGAVMARNEEQAEKCLAQSSTMLKWLEANNYNQTCYESLAAWMADMPLSTLLDSQDFHDFLKHLIEATDHSDPAVATSVFRALKQWSQPELLSLMKEEGVERACYTALSKAGQHSNYLINEGIALLDIFSSLGPSELPKEVTLSRARVLARCIVSTTSETTLIRAFNILGRLVSSCPDSTWFKGETCLIRAVRFTQAKLGSQIDEVEETMAAVLSVMGGEDMALMLMSQLLDDIKAVEGKVGNAAAASLEGLSTPFKDVSLYLVGVPDQPMRLFHGLDDCLKAIAPLLCVHPNNWKVREGVYHCATKALDLAQLLKDDDEALEVTSRLIKANLGNDLAAVLAKNCKQAPVLNSAVVHIEGLKLVAKLCECPTTSDWAMNILRGGGLMKECFRVLNTQPSGPEVHKALIFMAALGSHVEGFHMLQRSFKTLYGTKADYWTQELANAEGSIMPGDFARYLYNFVLHDQSAVESILRDPSGLKGIAEKVIESLTWCLMILVKSITNKPDDMAIPDPSGVESVVNAYLGRIKEAADNKSMSPIEMLSALEPVSEIMAITAINTDKHEFLDAVNNKAFEILQILLEGVSGEMNSSHWRQIMPNIIKSVEASNYACERAVRCVYPSIQSQYRFFKGLHSAIRDDAISLLERCRQVVEVPDYEMLLARIGGHAASAAALKPSDQARAALLRERNAGHSMNTDDSQEVRHYLPILAEIVDELGSKPLNPNDEGFKQLRTCLETMSWLKNERQVDLTPCLRKAFLRQANPTVLAAVIRCVSNLRARSPLTVVSLFKEGDNEMSHLLSELVLGLPNCTGDERLERLQLFLSGIPSNYVIEIPLIAVCSQMFFQSSTLREKRYILRALSKVVSSRITPELSAMLISVLLESLGDERLQKPGTHLFEICVKSVPNFDELLGSDPRWQKLVSTDTKRIGSLLAKSPSTREAILKDEAQLRRWIDELPSSAMLWIELCRMDKHFGKRFEEYTNKDPAAKILEKIEANNQSQMLLLLTFIKECPLSAEAENSLAAAFKTCSEGDADAVLIEACSRHLSAHPITAHAEHLLKALEHSRYSASRSTILGALLETASVEPGVKQSAIRQCIRDRNCQRVIISNLGLIDTHVLSELLNSGVDEGSSLKIMEALGEQVSAWNGSVATHLVEFIVSTPSHACFIKGLALLRKALNVHAPTAAKFRSSGNADWDDEQVPSEGHLPISYAIPRPISQRAWQKLELLPKTCGALAATLIQRMNMNAETDEICVDMLAYLACEKPVGLEAVWYTSGFFGQCVTLLKRTTDPTTIYRIGVITANVACVSESNHFLQLKRQNDLWIALEERSDQFVKNGRKTFLETLFRFAHGKVMRQGGLFIQITSRVS